MRVGSTIGTQIQIRRYIVASAILGAGERRKRKTQKNDNEDKTTEKNKHGPLALLQISPVSSGKLSQQHLINKQQDQVVLVEARRTLQFLYHKAERDTLRCPLLASTPKVGREAAAQCARVT